MRVDNHGHGDRIDLADTWELADLGQRPTIRQAGERPAHKARKYKVMNSSNIKGRRAIWHTLPCTVVEAGPEQSVIIVDDNTRFPGVCGARFAVINEHLSFSIQRKMPQRKIERKMPQRRI